MMKLESWEAKKTKQVATSAGCPGRPIGEVNCSWAEDGMVAGMSGVQIGPGQTVLTRMPLLSCWLDKARVNATIAPLVEE